MGALRYSSNNTSKWLYYNSYSLNVYEIRHHLVESRYPVHLVNILTDRFANGFLLHHPGQMNNLMSISNIVSLELEQMLWDKINFEIDKRRIMGPFVSPPFNSFHIPPSYILHTIYNSLILPHINYSLLAWGMKCQKIELLQKKAVRVVHSKSPIAHTNPLFRKMNNLRVSDLYTCNLLKMHYKLYRNMLPVYFESFIPEYGDYRHNLRNDQIRLPLIRCEYEEMNVKYQMHLRLRELSTPSNPPKYPSITINDDTLNKSLSSFSKYIKDEFLSSYTIVCTTPGCYSCEGWLLKKSRWFAYFVHSYCWIFVKMCLLALHNNSLF